MRRFSEISIRARVGILVALVAACASLAILASLPTITDTVTAEPRQVGSMLALMLRGSEWLLRRRWGVV